MAGGGLRSEARLPVESPSKSRITATSDGSRLRVQFQFRSGTGEMLWFAAVLAFQALVALLAADALVEAVRESRHLWVKAIVAGMALMLGMMSAFASVALALHLFGRQEITIDDANMSVTTALAGLRWSQSYLSTEVMNLRVDEQFVHAKGGKRLIRGVVFDYRGKVVRTRGHFSREEAEELRHLLAQNLGGAPQGSK
jgi:hypothetical protein